MEIRLWDYLPNGFGEKYQENNAAFLSCIECGRNTSKQGKSQGVFIVNGGYSIAHPSNPYPENGHGGDMGWFPVGSECIKKVPAEYRAPNPYKAPGHGVN